MFRSLATLADIPVVTRDGDRSRLRSFLFDDRSWLIRFLVVEVGSWFARRLVVVPASAFDEPDWTRRVVSARLTESQLLQSPDVDAVRPVSRQQQLALCEHFGWPEYVPYWFGPSAMVPAQREFPIHSHDDPHLRRTLDLAGYQVWATDHYLGLLEDFALEQDSWHINYLLVRVGQWIYVERFISTLHVKAISRGNRQVTLDCVSQAA